MASIELHDRRNNNLFRMTPSKSQQTEALTSFFLIYLYLSPTLYSFLTR